MRNEGGKLEALPNKAIGGAGDPAHAPFSLEQGKLNADGFYARMAKLINPKGLDAEKAYRETLDALVEQMTVRIGSVGNGEKFEKENGAPLIPMPEGAKIFETKGPWEDYATPSRDMRLIIAHQRALSLPDRIVAHPELYSLGGKKPDAVRGEITKLHAKLTGEKANQLPAHGRHPVEADGRRSAGPQGEPGDGLQPERLRRAPLGRLRRHPRSRHLRPPRPRRPARQDDRVP